MTKLTKKQRHQVKSRWYYIFWGAATLSVFAGQMYVGSGYRQMSRSFDRIMDAIIVEIENNVCGSMNASMIVNKCNVSASIYFLLANSINKSCWQTQLILCARDMMDCDGVAAVAIQFGTSGFL